MSETNLSERPTISGGDDAGEDENVTFLVRPIESRVAVYGKVFANPQGSTKLDIE